MWKPCRVTTRELVTGNEQLIWGRSEAISHMRSRGIPGKKATNGRGSIRQVSFILSQATRNPNSSGFESKKGLDLMWPKERESRILAS
jgi:hypothetical protein